MKLLAYKVYKELSLAPLKSEVDRYHQQTEELRQGAERKDKDVLRLKFEQSLLKDKSSMLGNSL